MRHNAGLLLWKTDEYAGVRRLSRLTFTLILAFVAWSLAAQPAEAPRDPASMPLPFQEVWAYLSVGEESFWNAEQGISDLAYFSASVNSWGDLTGIPDVSRLKSYTGRKHLVLAVLENAALTHMALYPGFPVRAKLLDDLVKAAQPFDGLQLDFESVTSKDKEFFWSFLADLKARLPGKVLSLAVPARLNLTDDAYDYRQLERLVDRVIVMAYDEHWSGGPPGPVSSMEWGRRVARFAQSTISPGKLVMGSPFYGRAWAEKALSRAYKSSAIDRLLTEKQPPELHRTDGVPDFEYEESVKVKVFFDDRDSHRLRLSQYGGMGVTKVAFWRLGQEASDFWSLLALAPAPPSR